MEILLAKISGSETLLELKRDAPIVAGVCSPYFANVFPSRCPATLLFLFSGKRVLCNARGNSPATSVRDGGRGALLIFPFTSERDGNNCFPRIVQRDRFSYRRFSLSEGPRARARALYGYAGAL